MLSFDSCEFLSQANLSELALKLDVKELLADTSRDQLVFTVQVCDQDANELSRENHYFVANKEMRLLESGSKN